MAPFRAEAGKTYYIGIDAREGQLNYYLELTDVLPNDETENALAVLTGTQIEVPVFLATPNENDPQFPGLRNPATAWWSWTAPKTGPYQLTFFRNISAVGVFEAAAHALIGNKSNTWGVVNYLQFNATAGGSYLIGLAHAGFYPASASFVINPGVPHDNILAPVVLTGTPALHTTVYGGTSWTLLEPLPEWTGLNTLWYEWTAPAEGQYVVSAVQNKVIPQVAIFLEDEIGLLRLYSQGGSNPPGIGTIVRVQQGQKFVIGVATSPFAFESSLTVRIDPSPPNDSLWTPQLLEGLFFDRQDSTWGATRDLFDPPGYSSVWYSWKAETNTFMVLSAKEVDAVHVYQLGSENILLPIPSILYQFPYTFRAAAGSNYLIRFASSTVPQAFSFSLVPIPPNSSFSSATEIGGLTASAQGWTAGTPSGQIYWKWRAPDDCLVTFSSQAAETNVAVLLHATLHTEWRLRTNVMGTPDGIPLKPDTNVLQFVASSNVLYTIDVRTVLRALPSAKTVSTNILLNLFTEPFERAERLQPTPTAEWLLGGERPWTVSSNVTYNGEAVLESRLEPGVRQNWIEGTFYGTGTLQIAWKRQTGPLRAYPVHYITDGFIGAAGEDWSVLNHRLSRLQNPVRFVHTHLPTQPTDFAWIHLNVIPDEPLPLAFDVSRIWVDQNGFFQGFFSAQARTSYIIETSTNLVDWTLFRTISEPAILYPNFSFGTSAEIPQSFFRVIKK